MNPRGRALTAACGWLPAGLQQWRGHWHVQETAPSTNVFPGIETCFHTVLERISGSDCQSRKSEV